MARRSSSMRRTAARAACSTSSAPTRCRRASPTAGKAGTGAPSTSGAWTRSGRTRCRTTSSRTSPRTATRCCSGAATWRRPPWDGAATWQAGCASGSPSWASSRSHIAPDVNYTNAVHADLWIPVKPNTDAALQLAIAYTWIKEGTYDQEYLDTHAVGFENFRYYVMGGEDGVPKTPSGPRPSAASPATPSRRSRATGPSTPCPSRTATAAPSSGPATRTSRRAWKWRFWACRAWASRARTSSSSSNGRSTAWSR